jgi:hypothetical protein
MMGHRTGTPMRLVSPAPVLVPGAGPRPQAPPTIYQPQQPQGTQQTIYSQQNNNNVGGKRGFNYLVIHLTSPFCHQPGTRLLDVWFPLFCVFFFSFTTPNLSRFWARFELLDIKYLFEHFHLPDLLSLSIYCFRFSTNPTPL